MTTRIELKDYRFTNLQIQWVQQPLDPVSVVPSVDIFDGKPPEELPNTRLVRLDIRTAPPPEHAGYEIALSIVGVFDIHAPGDDPARTHSIVMANGATILYGIVRAEIASLTSNFPAGRALLSTVYMHEVLKRQSERPSTEAPGTES